MGVKQASQLLYLLGYVWLLLNAREYTYSTHSQHAHFYPSPRHEAEQRPDFLAE